MENPTSLQDTSSSVSPDWRCVAQAGLTGRPSPGVGLKVCGRVRHRWAQRQGKGSWRGLSSRRFVLRPHLLGACSVAAARSLLGSLLAVPLVPVPPGAKLNAKAGGCSSWSQIYPADSAGSALHPVSEPRLQIRKQFPASLPPARPEFTVPRASPLLFAPDPGRQGLSSPCSRGQLQLG